MRRQVSFLLVSLLTFSGGFSGARDLCEPMASRPAVPTNAGQEKEKKQDSELQRIPEIPPGKLPPATRSKPDPDKIQYVRSPVYVDFTETLLRSDGRSEAPKPGLIRPYLEEYARRSGHPIAARAEDAVYILRGELKSRFQEELKFQGKTVAYKVRGSSRAALVDRSGKELAVHEIPDISQESVKSEESAFRKLRRYVAKLHWDHHFKAGAPLSNQDVWQLINTLAISNPNISPAPTAEDVIQRLADHGMEAVPCLLEALSDTRTVHLSSAYSGLEEAGPSALKIYHIADKALEEIFQKVSRLGLGTPARLRFVIIKGWENEWRRFCPSFRDSPNQPRQKDSPPNRPASGR